VEVLALARHLRELLGVGALKQVGREEAGAVVVLPTVGGVPHHLAPVDVTHSCRTQTGDVFLGEASDIWSLLCGVNIRM